MSNKNQRIYLEDREHLQMLADEQKYYIGREFHLDLKNGVLTIFALPQRKRGVKKDKEHKDRDKRSEKFERRT